MDQSRSFLDDPDLLESPWLRRLYDAFGRRTNPGVLARLARRFEGGEARSRTLRRLLLDRYEIRAEAFSYGAFHVPAAAEPGLTIGRFASISRDVRWGLGHPLDHVALSHLFADPRNGFVDAWPPDRPTLEIGPDAWIGAQVVITTGCRRIGVGAAIGAGSVVTRDVPDFAVCVGAPARVVRYRFPEETRSAILASRWWERSLAELRACRPAFTDAVKAPGTLAALRQITQAEGGGPERSC